MTTLREAATQALEALDAFMQDSPRPYDAIQGQAAMDALRAALVEDTMQKFTDVNQELEAALGCEHCNQPLYAAVKCRVCGRVSSPEPVQEPVAWMVYTLDGKSVCVTDNPADFIEWRSLPLYTSPPKRKPLTEEEIIDLWAGVSDPESPDISMIDFARAIERAHGIGGEE